MTEARDRDRRALAALGRDELLELFFHQIRNVWRVDGLYFLGIEQRFGTEAATAVDRDCWRTMASLEAKALRKLLGLGDGLEPLARALSMTSWALDHEEKELERLEGKVVFRVLNCRTQVTRLKKGLEEFPCKPVRSGYLGAFAEAFGCGVECLTCPPDAHEGELWCEWVFTAAPAAAGR